MANPTTNFGWVMPTATDLVTDLPADFAVFGQGVDTSMAYLLGGTTGQILSKTSGTNMAFTWINNDQGDITGITATSPLTGGGSSGAITVGIQDATTSVKGSVQLSDSTSTTSSVLAATPTAVKSAYDLADAAIAKTTVTTAGDIIYRNATVPARLGIGTAGQVLTVNSGATAPQWSTPAGGGKVLQVVYAEYSTNVAITTDSSYSDTGSTITITPTSATSKVLIFSALAAGLNKNDNLGQGGTFQLLRGATTVFQQQASANSALFTRMATGDSSQTIVYGIYPINYLDSPATTSATTYKIQGKVLYSSASGKINCQSESTKSTMIAMEIGA